jgi:hypothetical protein
VRSLLAIQNGEVLLEGNDQPLRLVNHPRVSSGARLYKAASQGNKKAIQKGNAHKKSETFGNEMGRIRLENI